MVIKFLSIVFQLSTNSLPDIKELKESKLSIASNSNAGTVNNFNGRATTERIRSRSIQHNPITISGPTSIAVRPKNLFKSSTQDDLMASLEFMNSLAADLPSGNNSHHHHHHNHNSNNSSGPLWLTAASPLKRSHTVQARRVVKIGNGNVSVVKPPNQFLPQQTFSVNEVMRKPPLPKLSLASPVSTTTSFAMSIPVQQQPQQPQQPQPQKQQHYPSHYVVLPPNAGGVTYYRNNNFNNSNLTPTVKAILSPSVCEQVYWPHQQQQLQQQQQGQQQKQPTQQQQQHFTQYHQASSPRPSRPTELFVRDIPYAESRTNTRPEPEPPVPPRSSSEGPSCSDTPPPLPVRKFRRVYTSNDVIEKDGKDELYSKPEKPKPSSTTQTSPRLYRTALSVDSGVMMGSPSPPTDSGIGVSPPTQVRQHVQQQQQQKQQHLHQPLKTRVSVRHSKEDEDDEELVRIAVEDAAVRRQRAPSSDDTASLCSSALSVESDTSGSRYDNVLRARIPSMSVEVTQPPVTPAKTSTLVAAAAEIAAATYLTAAAPVTSTGLPILQSRDEDGDDEDTDSNSNSDSDNLDLDSYSDDCDSDHEDDEKEEEELVSKEKPDKFHHPGLRLPLHRNSGPYENFKPDPKIEEAVTSPFSVECSSSSSFSSNSSSPKIIGKKTSRILKRSEDMKPADRPDLPPRENGSNHPIFNARRVHSSDVGVHPAPNDSSMRHFLAAGQTSNV